MYQVEPGYCLKHETHFINFGDKDKPEYACFDCLIFEAERQLANEMVDSINLETPQSDNPKAADCIISELCSNITELLAFLETPAKPSPRPF